MGFFKPNIQKMKTKKDVEGLIKVLKDEDSAARDEDRAKEAAEALGEIGELAVEPLIEALKGEGIRVRWDAAWALGMIGDARAIEALTQALEDKSQALQIVAKLALVEILQRKVAKEVLKKIKAKKS